MIEIAEMRSTIVAILLCLFVAVTSCWSLGASCEDVKKMPADAKEVASGVVNPPFVKSFTAGQRVFVKVRNDTVHLTPVTVTIAGANGDPEYCVSALDAPPQKTLIFSTAVFGERISWQVRVVPGDVDVVQLLLRDFWNCYIPATNVFNPRRALVSTRLPQLSAANPRHSA